MSSGDDLELGAVNGASDRTVLVGHKSRPSVDFTANTVFHVSSARGGHRLSPDRDVTAIVGVGNRGGRGVIG